MQDWLSGADEAISSDPDFLDWIGDATLEEVWSDCPWADRMIWLAAYNAGWPGWPSDADVVKVTCWCARRPRWTNKISLAAIKAAERWAEDPCQKNAEAADRAAWDAGAVARASRMEWAAIAAEWTARAVKNPPYAAPRAVGAAIAAAADRKRESKIMCDYMRENLNVNLGDTQ